MKTLLATTPFFMGTLLGIWTMYLSIMGKLNASPEAEITTFSMGFLLTVICTYATFKTLKNK